MMATAVRPTLGQTFDQALTMAWRALIKMRRNPEQFFDVTIQPLLFTAMFAFIFGGGLAGSVQNYLPWLITGILAQTGGRSSRRPCPPPRRRRPAWRPRTSA